MKDRALLAILAAGLAVHLLSAGFVIAKKIPVSPMQDALEYRLLGLDILHHGTFSILPPEERQPIVFRSPGYPLFLAATYAVESRGYLAIILQQFMLIASAALIFALLRKFSVRRGIALVFAALYLLEPQVWLYSLQTMTETSYSLLFLSLLALALLPSRLRPLPRYAIFGLLLGISLLVKPTSLMYAPFLTALLLLPEDGSVALRGRVRGAVLASAIAFLIVVPWIARNHRLTGEWILSSSAEFNFIAGMGTEAEHDDIRQGPTIYDDKGRPAFAFDGFTVGAYGELKEMTRGIAARENKIGMAKKQIACASTVWFDHDYDTTTSIIIKSASAELLVLARRVDEAVWTLMLALFLIGSAALLADRRHRLSALPLLPMVALTVYLNFCMSYARILVPMFPIVFLAAGVALTHVVLRRAD
jgi:4-amino-4-deoxy-L-arabinose transferase-like glycosyltransferase